MQVSLLGPLIVRDGAGEVAAGGRRQRRVLARLAMDAGRPVSTTDLEAAYWGDDPPPAARRTIAAYMFRLRRLGLLIATQDDHYTLDTTTDVGEVERLAGESRRASLSHDPQRAIGALSEALALWRGRPLADLDDLPEATIVGGLPRRAGRGAPGGIAHPGARPSPACRADRPGPSAGGRATVSRAALGAADACSLSSRPPGRGPRRLRRVSPPAAR